MRIDFEDKSYIMIENTKDGKVSISIGAADQDNPLSFVVNTTDMSKEDFKKLISDI